MDLSILKSKTVRVALVGLVATVLEAVKSMFPEIADRITPEAIHAAQALCVFMGLIFLRAGVEKAGKKTGQ